MIIFAPLTDMPGQGHGLQLDENLPRRLRSEGSLRDVFAMIKSYMSDRSLTQPPLLVYPQCFMTTTEQYFNDVNQTDDVIQQVLDPERISGLEALANGIEKDFPHLDRTVRYYRSIVDMDRARKPMSRIGFLDVGPPPRHGLANVQLPQRAPEPDNHWLQVVFHHSRGRA